MAQRRRALLALLVTAAALAAAVVAPSSSAQEDPISGLFTTTSGPPPSTATSTTVVSDQSPPGAEDVRGDGAPVPEEGIRVPPEAQRIIDSVRRTGSNSNGKLLTALSELVALGLDQDEAYRVGLGRFPVAGPARYSHDWLYPRYGPGFRFHLGTDVFAAAGTPLRAPVDGIAETHQDPLGGLSVRVVMPDRTYFYLAHLSGLVEGFTNGMAVETGDIVGYVGDSGNARGGAPHVHVGVYPKGGPPVDPKPILDQFLAEATARVPELIAQYRAAHPVTDALAIPVLPVSAEARLLRPTLATQVLHPYASGGDLWSPAVLYVVGTDPAAGAGYVLQSTLDDLAADIDWSARAP
jgi:murein DD-endopeptidase MepM/ murein hydrolase activator NlpD